VTNLSTGEHLIKKRGKAKKLKKSLVFLAVIGLIFGVSAAAVALTDTMQRGTGLISEPATMLVFGAGLIGVAGFGRKKVSKKS
jgi:hypothetical protein